MAQQFVLKGVKELRDYTYTGSSAVFAVKNDPRGGDTWQLPTWFAKKGNNVKYISCTVLDLVGTNYLMVIPTSMDTQLMVTYDDDVYNIILSNFNAVDRVLITGKDVKTPVIEYLLPSVSGGAIAKRIVKPADQIGAFTITGKGNVETGQSTQYSSNATPDVDDAVYAWTVINDSNQVVPSGQAEITAGQTAAGCTVAWKTAGSYGVKCQITSATAADSPQTDTRDVTCTTAATVGTVTVSGSGTPEAESPEVYTASVSGNTVNDLTYQWSVLDATAQISNPNAASSTITFDAEGNATVQCAVGSSSTDASGSDTLDVVVSTAKKIDGVTINADSTTPTATVADNFQAVVDGNIADATYAWTVSPADGTFNIATPNAEATNITFNAIGSYEVRCEVSSATAQNSPQSADPVSVTVAGLPSMPGVTLGGTQTITDADINVGKNYTSNTSDGSTLSGTTTYQWTATDEDTGETTGIGVVFTPEDATEQNIQVVYTAAAQGRTIALRCKWTNNAYTDSPKTGKRAVTIEAAP